MPHVNSGDIGRGASGGDALVGAVEAADVCPSTVLGVKCGTGASDQKHQAPHVVGLADRDARVRLHSPSGLPQLRQVQFA